MREPLVQVTRQGLYCERGGFHIDPWRPVERAVLTHAHSDHARPGSARYLATTSSLGILRRRLGADAVVEGMAYGEERMVGGVRVSLHPAGHVLGSAQVRLEADGEVWVVAGDYKRAADPSCEPFEVVRCHTFVSEATFALPIYRWAPGAEVAHEIFTWWEQNRAAGINSMVFAYAFGKAQRILAELTRWTDRPVIAHGAVEALVECYREAGVAMVPTTRLGEAERRVKFAGELIVAPPSAFGSAWMRRFQPLQTGFASGWMRVRGVRRRKGYDRGFVLSDHADWPDLLRTVDECGAEQVIATHGFAETLARALRDRGKQARTFGAEAHAAWADEDLGGQAETPEATAS